MPFVYICCDFVIISITLFSVFIYSILMHVSAPSDKWNLCITNAMFKCYIVIKIVNFIHILCLIIELLNKFLDCDVVITLSLWNGAILVVIICICLLANHLYNWQCSWHFFSSIKFACFKWIICVHKSGFKYRTRILYFSSFIY